MSSLVLNDTVIVKNGLFNNSQGVIKKVGNKEYMVELTIFGKRVTDWFVEKNLIKKDASYLNDWVMTTTDYIRKDTNNNIVAHIMYMSNNDDYLAYVYKPKGNTDMSEYERFASFELATWWCDEKLVELGYGVK